MIIAGQETSLPTPSKPSRLRYALIAAVVPLIFLLVALWTSHEQDAAEQATSAARLSYERRLALTDLVSSLKDAETGQRGYVITGDRTFLEPYMGARENASDRLADLRRRYRDDPAATRRVELLARTVEAKFAEMAAVLRLRDARGGDAAQAVVAQGRGKRLMDRIRSTTAGMSADEDLSLGRREALARERALAIRDTTTLLLVAIAGAVCIGLLMLWRQDNRRYRLEREGREASARLRAIFDSTLDAILILNPSGTIESMNAAATTLLGYTADELSRADVSVILDIADGDGSFHERVGIVDGQLAEPWRIDRVARRKDGEPVPVDVALGMMQLPDGVHVVAALRDATERKAVERMKDEFISTVSHELRTPLTSVVGSLGLLRSGGTGELPDGARRLVEIAESNSRRLIRLINDMLDLEKIGSGKMRFDMATTDIVEVVGAALTSSEGLARSHGVALVAEPAAGPLLVTGDAERLVQVITNLLSNAIRFSPQGGTVRIAAARHEDRAIVTVDDEGPGVPAEFRDRIFTRFAQAGGSAEPAGGSGLGLAISREIVRAHDGRIWFEDAPGRGARFAFSLTLLPEQPPAPLSRPRLLLCGHDEDAAIALRAMLADAGYELDRVRTLADIPQAARQQRYAALLLDLQPPEHCGLDIIPALRRDERTKTLPIIVVSGLAAEMGGGIPLEIVDWLTKPIAPDALGRAIHAAMQRSQAAHPTLLHIDDDRDLLEVVAAVLDGQGRLLKATSLASARAVLTMEKPDIVILDVGLPDGSGADLLPLLVDHDGVAIPTIVYSAQDVPAEIEAQVQAVLVKSRRSLPHLATTIQRILTRVPEAPVE